MRPHTLNSMMVPNQAPNPMMTLARETGCSSRPKVKVLMHRPWVCDSRYAPASQVPSADQRNQSKARGATYLLMPAPPGPPPSPPGAPPAPGGGGAAVVFEQPTAQTQS